MKQIKLYDFNKICRFCLKFESADICLLPMNASENKNFALMATSIADNDNRFSHSNELISNIQEVVDKCIGLKINTNDRFPSMICNLCTEQLRKSYEFRNNCIASHKYLNEIIIKYEKNIELEKDFLAIVNNKPNHLHESLVKLEIQHEDQDITNDVNAVCEDKKPSQEMLEIEQHLMNTKRTSINKVLLSKKRLKTESLVKSSENLTKKRKKKYKLIQCEICGVMQTNITVHMFAHTEFKQFECYICGKRLKTSSSLKQHFKIHMNYRPFKCSLCVLSFLQKAHLRRHVYTHTGEKRYKCDICDKAFAQSATLNEHRLIHSQEKTVDCPYCPKLFKTKKGLKSHIGIHTGERFFKCDVCPESFISSSSLSVHRRKHKQENPYFSCTVCDVKFLERKHLKYHLREHGFYLPSKSREGVTSS